MTQKLSPHKLSRMMALYFEGYSQSAIANKLKVDQSTVSLHISKLKSLAEQQGFKAAGEEFDIMDEVEVLHSLGAELRKAKLTVEEAKIGLKMEQLFRRCGIEPEDYKHLTLACTKMKSEGFINSAVKLSKLENSTGMTYEKVVAQFDSTYQQLEETQENVQIVTGKLNKSKEELANINKQKKLASQDLGAHMNNIGIDMNRLTLVEDLALTLKKASISNEELGNYTQQQQLLNKAGISLDIFIEIVEKAKVLTLHDQGKGLLQMLSDYGGLTEATEALQTKAQSLDKQVDSLEQKAKLKGEIEGDIVKLRAERASLETYVAQLYDQKNTLDNIKSDVSSLAEKKAKLEHEITELKDYRNVLSDDIKAKEQKVDDLKELELKHDMVSASLSEIETKKASEATRWEIFESFLGFIGSSSFEEVDKFVDLLPYLIAEARQGRYSPEILRNIILRNLTGYTLQLLQCTSCYARFVVDKPSDPHKGYQCPICGLSYQVRADQEGLAILKAALAAPKPQQIIVVQSVSQELKKSTPKGKESA